MVDTRFHMSNGPQTLGALLANSVEKPELEGKARDIIIEGAEELAIAKPGHIALAANRRYADDLVTTSASVVIIGKALRDKVPPNTTPIIAVNPQALFTDLLDQLYPDTTRELLRANAAAKSDPSYWNEKGVILGLGAIVGTGAEIGEGSIVGPGAVIGSGVTIGENCLIETGASIECTHIGNDVTVHAGARIGTEGFGWIDQGRTNRKVPQLGRVIVQDRVEIGANTTIDRGALGDTVIGEGTKIDNLVQIGHNCRIGRNCLIAATSGISGSTIVGDGVLMGGGVGTAGHLTIGDGCIIFGRTAVTKDWPAGSKLAGAPAQDVKSFWRELAQIRRLVKGDQSELED